MSSLSFRGPPLILGLSPLLSCQQFLQSLTRAQIVFLNEATQEFEGLPRHIGASISYYLNRSEAGRGRYAKFRACLLPCINDPRAPRLQSLLRTFIGKIKKIQEKSTDSRCNLSCLFQNVFLSINVCNESESDFMRDALGSLRKYLASQTRELYQFLLDVTQMAKNQNLNPIFLLSELLVYLKVESIQQYAQIWKSNLNKEFLNARVDSLANLGTWQARKIHFETTINFYREKIALGNYPAEGSDFNWVQNVMCQDLMRFGYQFAKEHQQLFANPNEVWNFCIYLDSQDVQLPIGITAEKMRELKQIILSKLSPSPKLQRYCKEFLSYWLPRMANWRNLVEEYLSASERELVSLQNSGPLETFLEQKTAVSL